jgi:hypothetical protein
MGSVTEILLKDINLIVSAFLKRDIHDGAS